jgi:hypothetical protein
MKYLSCEIKMAEKDQWAAEKVECIGDETEAQIRASLASIAAGLWGFFFLSYLFPYFSFQYIV